METPEAGTKTCTKCGIVKLIDDFGLYYGTKRRPQCKQCLSDAAKVRTAGHVAKESANVATLRDRKRCSMCGTIKPASPINYESQFYKCKGNKDGYQNKCKSCSRREKVRDYRKESTKLRIAQYRATDKGKEVARKSDENRRGKRAEAMREYYQRPRSKLLVQIRKTMRQVQTAKARVAKHEKTLIAFREELKRMDASLNCERKVGQKSEATKRSDRLRRAMGDQ